MPTTDTVGELHVAAEPLRDRLEASPVIGWLKHLDGRYAYVNPTYVQALAAPPERLIGRTDTELEPREAIDGPRLRDGGPPEEEPIMLEYRVAAFEGRPAFAVMRFPVRDRDGDTVAVCGVAAPFGDAPLVRSECADLMELEGGGSPSPDGELEQQRRRLTALHEASATASRRAHELASELASERAANEQLRRELEGARARLTELEHASITERSGPQEVAALNGGPHWSAAAQRALATALNDASEWRVGLRDVVKVVGREAGWDAVCAWVPDERGRTLRCAAMWTAGAEDDDEFETRTWQRPYPLAGGELGRAFGEDRASWQSGLSAAEDERLLAAAREGMRAAVLVPVRSGRSPVALLELLSRRELSPDAELAAAMDAIALQLGHFWQLLRQGAAPHWRLGRL